MVSDTRVAFVAKYWCAPLFFYLLPRVDVIRDLREMVNL